MKIDVKDLLKTYLEWLGTQASQEQLDGGWSSITLPYLDRHNDYLQVFIREEFEGVRITDDGRIIRDLANIGCDLKAVGTKRRRLASTILRGMGLDIDAIDTGEITTNAVNGDFAGKLHSVLMSMMAIDGLAVASPPNIAAIFKDDVVDWLRALNIDFQDGATYRGHSGNNHKFDFLVRSKTEGPSKILQVLSKPDRMHVQSFTYEVIDTLQAVQGVPPDFFALYSDSQPLPQHLRNALYSHRIEPVQWSERDALRRRIESN
ncbi:DUF1828 domain-containing protein [Tundrisphaera lichenicola]|uniref:DUF1828 domain-containing protein n=1 Tax=Tundrisphaera lichenicola TaxID=2029860 RepID=UPI003EBE6A06